MRIKFLQEGGPAPQGGNPLDQLVAMAQQAIDTNDPNLAMQVCQTLVQAVQTPAAQEAPAQEPPAEEPAAEPVYRSGGVLVRRIRK